jgi:hypothetical protein
MEAVLRPLGIHKVLAQGLMEVKQVNDQANEMVWMAVSFPSASVKRA